MNKTHAFNAHAFNEFAIRPSRHSVSQSPNKITALFIFHQLKSICLRAPSTHQVPSEEVAVTGAFPPFSPGYAHSSVGIAQFVQQFGIHSLSPRRCSPKVSNSHSSTFGDGKIGGKKRISLFITPPLLVSEIRISLQTTRTV